ncbi:hypothetical protein [Asaia bogorensis]|uniref:hypothetical protein n=1 Tax=Asaia bogorensis TaxID=91915 RepID=UPI003019392C
MTHEQKPESAEFRTREAQVTDLAFEISDWKSYDDNEDIPLARAHLIEAEARGAAEQRRKDAEGVEPFAWVSPEDVDPRNTWCNGNGYGFRILEHHSIQTPTATIPLYTGPANVAALEDRVKELEAQLGAMKNGTIRQVIHSPLRHFKPEDRS